MTSKQGDPIPYFSPTIGEEEEAATLEVLRSGWLTTGKQTKAFEEEFAAAVNAEFAVALNSCTAALHLALVAAGVGPGDEVIVPTMTFAATAEVVAYTGATLVLVDVNSDTLCIDVDAVREALTDRTKAVMPVHYGGQAADLRALAEVVEPFGVKIVEDAAHAFPSRDADGNFVGATGNATCFSFYANKTITTGEGGMFTTQDEDIANRVRQLSLHGLDRNAWRRWETRASWDYDIIETGFKYNLGDLASAIGRVQLSKADEFADKRRRSAELYGRAFDDHDTVQPLSVPNPEHSAWHLYVIRVPELRHRTSVIEHLRSLEIGTSVHYKPLHRHPQYEGRFGNFDVADDQFDRIVSLPLSPTLEPSEVERVAEAVLEGIRSC